MRAFAADSVLPAIRATTHVEGTAIRWSRRARRGAGCRFQRRPRRLRRDADIEQPDCVAAGVAAVVLSQGAHYRMDVPVGEGSARPRSGRSSEVRPRARLRPLPPAFAVVGTRPDGALECRALRERPQCDASDVQGEQPVAEHASAHSGTNGSSASTGAHRTASAVAAKRPKRRPTTKRSLRPKLPANRTFRISGTECIRAGPESKIKRQKSCKR